MQPTDINTALLNAFEQFQALRRKYEKARDEWRDEADVNVVALVQRTEAMEGALAGKLDQIDRVLGDFSAEIGANTKDLNHDLDESSSQSVNPLLSAAVQLEVLRLIEMKMLLPEKMWHAETGILQQVLSQSPKTAAATSMTMLDSSKRHSTS
ncbi:hypothetical protein F5879DRAFT_994595 [Lentinula edodes]|nr:hypothetical protein F5879DRAFT_994595 [Lentinula edodes]